MTLNTDIKKLRFEKERIKKREAQLIFDIDLLKSGNAHSNNQYVINDLPKMPDFSMDSEVQKDEGGADFAEKWKDIIQK